MSGSDRGFAPGAPPAMVVTDLDGTLLDDRSRLSAGNRAALEALGAAGVVRVVATGRSLHSARSVLDARFPVDYLVFSTGVGVLDWSEQALLDEHRMTAAQVARAIEVLEEMEVDYMIHHAVPDNHRYHFRRHLEANPDFDRRRARYREFGQPWDPAEPLGVEVSQCLAIDPAGTGEAYEHIRRELDELSIVLATSPLDHASHWVEIFPPQVSKARSAERLRRSIGVPRSSIAAVGNDYNDRDMLEWAACPYVVGNAVAALLERYEVVSANVADGFADVARAVLARLRDGAPRPRSER